MLIAWATPFNYRSAIGKFSRAVAEELEHRGHEVAMVRLETGPELDLAPLATKLPVVSAHEVDIDSFDEVVVNFGNHAPYHSQCLSILARRPPLGIFHDAEFRDFEWGLRQRHRIDIPRLIGISDNGELPSEDELVAPEGRPLLGSLAAMCWGAVIHGPHYQRAVADYCAGPVETIPLCYPDPGNGAGSAKPTPGRRVTIFGVISEHKQPRRVMRAIAKLEKRLGPIELHLAGAIEEPYRARLLQEAKELRIQPPCFHGYVSDENLQQLIENSHAVCVLRFPVTEGGSASLATALYRQRPLIIADIASYAMVPDDMAFKVSYSDDADDVAEALSQIFDDASGAEARATRARHWAEGRLSADSYVNALLPLLRKSHPSASLARLARDLVPAITNPSGQVIKSVVPDVSEVLEWMNSSQAP